MKSFTSITLSEKELIEILKTHQDEFTKGYNTSGKKVTISLRSVNVPPTSGYSMYDDSTTAVEAVINIEG